MATTKPPQPLKSYQFFGRSPELDLSLEAQLLANGRPALFFYHWNSPILVLGRGQSRHTINTHVCADEDIPILSRLTGGTGVLHQQTLNIALILPRNHPWCATISGLYQRFCRLVKEAIPPSFDVSMWDSTHPARPRSPICFESHTEDTLLINQKKVFGSAQRRQKECVLIHGTLFLKLDIEQQSRVFNTSTTHIRSLMCSLPYSLDIPKFINEFRQRAAQELNLIEP